MHDENDFKDLFVRRGAAIAGGLAATFTAMWLLGMLNVHALPDDVPLAEIATVMLGQNENAATPPQKQQETTPETPPDQMPVEHQLPTPDVPTLDPLDIEIPDIQTEVPTIQVTVKKVIVEQAPKPTPRPVVKPTVAAPPAPPAPPTKPAVQSASKVQQPPRELGSNRSPRYPAREQAARITDTVRLKILIDERGRVQEVRYLRGSKSFQDAVDEVVYRWRFTPARDKGQAVPVWALKDVQFTLPR